MGNVPSRKVIRKNKDDYNNIPQEDSNIIPAELTGNGFCIRADSSVKIIGCRPYLDEEVSTYIFPTDWEEADRVQMCHFILKKLLDGSYAANLSDIIKPDSKILDIGCGPGHWCFEVAQQFPEAEVYGVDIVSSFPNEIKPSNCYFQLCNVLEGLPFANDEFDYVFMRHMIPAFKKDQWAPLFDEIMRVLKPGGVVESVEFEWAAKSMGPVHTQFLTQWFEMTSKARSMDFQFTSKLEQTIKDTGFQNVTCIRKAVPLGKWDEKLGSVTEIWTANLAQMAAGMKSLSAQIMGISEEEWTNLVDSILQEFDEYRTYHEHLIILATK
ncbi:S-adenosyl-L-methionine-dependent methyltransferase [Gigaspora rosea]|uniref:S-adenosyl-L-methionine-dependent methyltransferase n=1 Tax=Gigaspora rosea TaxID=44941 RepID=A0A397W7J4_9GLOM|nr:S-adenosyl-L-methionine-dependent methyltransferase [Gigaspora rosea]